MIPRYSSPEMASLFSDEARMSLWLEIEILAVEAQSALGTIPDRAGDVVRRRAPAVDAAFVAAVAEREKVTDHDVAAFVDVVQQAIDAPEGAWVHHGLTSSDVVDTALSVTLVRACDLLIAAADRLIATLAHRARKHAELPMVGRTHGIHAEPTTFGSKLALSCLQVDRDRTRLRRARDGIAVGKLSGAVGTYANVDPAAERRVCDALGLRPVPATQVISRDRHAEYLWACASAGATVEAMATEIRHLQRSEVAEIAEPFGEGQKGSSAMPHKQNPITAERLCGLARLLRGYLVAGLEDIVLWHERDISHSSVERVALPDASLLAFYVLEKMTTLIDGLVVRPERMRANLEASRGTVFSQAVLLAMVDEGMPRDTAYRIVQRDARRAIEEGRPLRAVLSEDAEVTLTGERIERAFSLEHALRRAHRAIDALDEVEGT